MYIFTFLRTCLWNGPTETLLLNPKIIQLVVVLLALSTTSGFKLLLLCAEILECLRNGHALRYSFDSLFVHRYQLRHQLQDWYKQIARDDDYSFEWITEDNITLEIQCINFPAQD